MAPHGDDDHYKPKDAISNSIKGALITGGAGLFMAAIQNSLAKQNVGAWGVFTRGGGVITTFAATGGAYVFTHCAAANLREKNDHYNAAIAGGVAGAVLGLTTKRMPRVFGLGLSFAVIMGVADFTGGSLKGNKDREADEFARKEVLRMNRRRPIEETIAEVGEGRSIRPPGYEERRRQRLKETYGIDVQPVSADPNAA
ncbi:hypothetical protein B0T16DRAFT_326287 [Cercophora newfieldiana]|uniref:Uncharacterized protein n=1 Tax=Cercophora newfieldiana TaxID=92897 RepID=A0AA39YBR9_9PEZI|nr:hypothetical protein B0T16DRAFT_326287 [Cercophora newfieldiana]